MRRRSQLCWTGGRRFPPSIMRTAPFVQLYGGRGYFSIDLKRKRRTYEIENDHLKDFLIPMWWRTMSFYADKVSGEEQKRCSVRSLRRSSRSRTSLSADRDDESDRTGRGWLGKRRWRCTGFRTSSIITRRTSGRRISISLEATAFFC